MRYGNRDNMSLAPAAVTSLMRWRQLTAFGCGWILAESAMSELIAADEVSNTTLVLSTIILTSEGHLLGRSLTLL